MGKLRSNLSTAISAILTIVIATAAHAEDELRDLELTSAARKIAAVMRSQEKESASIFEFKDRTALRSTVLGGMTQLLSDELKKLGITIKDKGGSVGIKGTVEVPKDTIQHLAAASTAGPVFFELGFNYSTNLAIHCKMSICNCRIRMPGI